MGIGDLDAASRARAVGGGFQRPIGAVDVLDGQIRYLQSSRLYRHTRSSLSRHFTVATVLSRGRGLSSRGPNEHSVTRSQSPIPLLTPCDGENSAAAKHY